MPIENHKEEVPFAHYEALFRSADPEKLSRNALRRDEKEYYVNLLGREYAISHPDYGIRALDGGPVPSLTVQTFMLRYLLETKPTAWTGGWKTFREMPWGEVYIKPYTGRVLTRAAFTFGTRIDRFRAACEKMGAEKIGQADAGYAFSLIGNFRMRILIWEADEDFPPSAQILYSENFTAFSAEDRVVAADILIAAIKNFM